MPIHVQTPEGFVYRFEQLPFGGYIGVMKGAQNKLKLISDDGEGDIYDACALRIPISSYTRTECFFDPYEETERGEE